MGINELAAGSKNKNTRGLHSGTSKFKKEYQNRTNLKRSILWDLTPCTPLKLNLHYGKNCSHIFRIEE
jgi:hypothetical protein